MSPATDPQDDPAYELLALLGEELAAGDVDNRLVPSDGVAPAQLVIPLAAEDGTTAAVNLCFLPGHDYPAVVQYLVALDVDVRPEAVDTTARFLHLVNSSLPMTGFELGEAAAAVVFRHVQAVGLSPLDPAVIAWPLSMIYHAVTRFGPVIAQACDGTPYPDLIAAYGAANAALWAEG